jgi:hypothetical protein
MLIRRRFLAAGAAAMAASSASISVASERASVVSCSFRLKETAGLRRFGYPVFTMLPPELDGPNFRLERDGNPVSAQFRKVDLGQGKSAVALDFNTSPGPLDAETYTVKSGADVQPGPEPRKGMRVNRRRYNDQSENVWAVTNGSSLTYKVDEHLSGFLRSVSNAGLEFIGSEGPAFRAVGKDSISEGVIGGSPGHDAAGEPFTSSVLREGPLAVVLRFAGVAPILGSRVPMVFDMTFPSSKSWVEVSWTIEDPTGVVAGLNMTLRLKIESSPALVDLGASDTVYGQLKASEKLELVGSNVPALRTGGVPWSVEKVSNDKKSTFAQAITAQSAPAEGWAHSMDKSRCTAVAVADFGRTTRDAIVCGGDGTIGITRQFANQGMAPPKGRKSLRFWLHFVTNPVQIGAVTSPQAMLSPLVVEWI